MNEGRIQQFDVPERIYDRPENLFVAGFIGTPFVNLMFGRVASGENREIQMEGDFDLVFPVGSSLKGSQEVVVAVRPEDLTIYRETKKDTVEFVIDDSFNAGSALFLSLTRETSPLLASVERNFPSRRGDTVCVEFTPSSCNIYEKKSGNIIG
jgi:ABC-type sugar transport system ATPase subunit